MKDIRNEYNGLNYVEFKRSLRVSEVVSHQLRLGFV